MLTSVLSDQELVKKYLTGDNKSFELLLIRHKSRVFAFIMSKIKNRDITEDIFQDTFIKVINSLQKGKYNEEGKFLPWMMRIAHNLIIDYFRKEAKMKNVRPTDDFNIFDVLDLEEESIEDVMVNSQIMDDVRVLVEELPEDQKEVVRMRYFMQMSFKDIADKSGVSINTSLGRMRYALINLRKLIADKKLILTNS